MTNTRILVVTVALVVLARPVPADARQGIIASGVVGAASIESSNQVVVAGAIGYRVTRLVGFGVEVTSIPTLKPEVAAPDVTRTSVPALTVAGTDGRATMFTTNVRLEIPVTARFIPYVTGGGGVANVKETFTITVPFPPGVPAVIPPRSETRSSTDLALTVGGGISMMAATHVSIDVDLRYMRLIADRDLNVGRFGIGVGYRF